MPLIWHSSHRCTKALVEVCVYFLSTYIVIVYDVLNSYRGFWELPEWF